MKIIFYLLLRAVLMHTLCQAQSTETIRLVGGAHYMEGRVEVYYSGEWGTVCDDDWEQRDAAVVCRQLGYNTDLAQAYSNAHFGSGSARIWMDEVECNGFETSLFDCGFITNHDCSHYEDAGVSCGTPPVTGGIRLVDGTAPWNGRVEVELNGIWGTVCDDNWDDNDALVVCRQLGYELPMSKAYGEARFGQGTGAIHMDEVRCVGHEYTLWDCPAANLGATDCGHSEDAGVFCGEQATTPPCDNCNEEDTGTSMVIYISVSICGIILFAIATAVISKCCCNTNHSRERRVHVEPYPVRTVQRVPVQVPVPMQTHPMGMMPTVNPPPPRMAYNNPSTKSITVHI